jgi:hypothetical protein
VLAHAGPAVTADVYAKVGMDAKRRALATLAAKVCRSSQTVDCGVVRVTQRQRPHQAARSPRAWSREAA